MQRKLLIAILVLFLWSDIKFGYACQILLPPTRLAEINPTSDINIFQLWGINQNNTELNGILFLNISSGQLLKENPGVIYGQDLNIPVEENPKIFYRSVTSSGVSCIIGQIMGNSSSKISLRDLRIGEDYYIDNINERFLILSQNMISVYNITGQVISSFIFNEEMILKGLGATSPSNSKIVLESVLFIIVASGMFFVGAAIALRRKP